MAQRTGTSKAWYTAVLKWGAVLLIASLLRGGWLTARGAALSGDPDGYRGLAEGLAQDHVYGYRVTGGGTEDGGNDETIPTAFRPPLYPLLLALTGGGGRNAETCIGILHFVLGVSTVLLTLWLADRWRMGTWGIVAAMLVAADPILLNQSTLVMTETLATLLAVVCLIGLTAYDTRPSIRRAGLAGVVIGVATLCRPTFLAWAPIVALVMVVRSTSPSCALHRGLTAAALLAAIAVTLSPWIARNGRQFGRWSASTSHGGYTLMLGNNPGFYEFLQRASWDEVWDSQALDRRYNRVKTQMRGDEFAADQWAYQQAIACIRQQPRTFAYASLVRVARLWGVVPHQVEPSESTAGQLARYGVGVWYVFVFALAAIGLVALRRTWFQTSWMWGISLCLAFTAVHTMYWSNLRMRAPLMPVVCLLAAWVRVA